MRGLVTKLFALGAVCAAALALAAPALAAPHVEGTFDVEGAGVNNIKLAEGSDGNVWTTIEGGAKEVAKITPAGKVEGFELGGKENLGGIATGPEGNLFVVIKEGVARFAPTNPEGTLKTFKVSPKIEGFSSIVRGPNGQLWIATKDLVLHFAAANPEGGAVESPVAVLSPHDIDLAGTRIVVVGAATLESIISFNANGTAPETPTKIPFVNNPSMETSQGVAGSPSGQFAFSESDQEESLGLDTPPNPATAELRKVGDPFGVAIGVDRAYYFAMFGDGNVRRLVPGSPSTPIEGFPKGFGPRQVTAGPNNTIWVAEEEPGKAVKVTRIAGLEPPPTPAPGPIPSPVVPTPPVKLPQTRLGAKPKKVVKITAGQAHVKFGFSSSSAGARFECSLGHRVKPKHKKARFVGQSFKSCSSPKKYSLGPGKYRFQVRAVAGGVRDSSPAAYGFKVVRSGK